MEKSELAQVSGHGKARRVEVRRIVRAPIEKVWRALTEADQVRHWWSDGEIEAREGGRIKLGKGGGCGDDELPLDGEIKVFQPPYVLEFTWHEGYDPAQGLVRFDLVEVDDQTTQVTLVNIVPAPDIVPAAAGWHEIVERLASYLISGEPVPVPENDARFRELRSVYETQVG